MNALVIVLLVLLVLVIIAAIVMYYLLNNKLNYYKTVSQDIDSTAVIQKMFQIIGSNVSANNKIEELNDAIIKSYNSMYSTIAMFDGNSYEIKATNVDNTYIDSIIKVAEENDFKANVSKNISKYITTSPDKTLTYKSAIERRIKSALFSPIYYNNIYLGFWILEDEVENAYDDISKVELSKLKDNLGVFIENTQFQNTIELAQNTDKQTGFYNTMYLYSNIRNVITQNDTTCLTFICLKNIPEINDLYGRAIGNSLLMKIATVTKETMAGDAIIIRYSGLRFLIVSPGSNAERMQNVCERLLSRFKMENEVIENKVINCETQFLLHSVKKQNNIEKEIQAMESYMSGMKDVNTIKII